MTNGENDSALEHRQPVVPQHLGAGISDQPDWEPVPEPAPSRDPNPDEDSPSETQFPAPKPLAGPEPLAGLVPLTGFGVAGETRDPGADGFSDEPGMDSDQPLLFAQFHRQAPPKPQRIPNFGHLLIFLLLVIAGYLSSGIVVLGAMHFHMYGVSTLKQAANEIHYTLGSQAAWYLTTIAVCAVIFPMVWHRSFSNGLEWRGEAAIRLRMRLISAAMVCFVLAVVDGILIPGPADTPIDQIFRMPGAAWLLFGFGVTLAPLFEEITYRGFLLPALCTAYDWMAERMNRSSGSASDEQSSSGIASDNGIHHDRPTLPEPVWRPAWLSKWAPPPAPGGGPDTSRDDHPHWSLPAMIVGSFLTSIPFALMHGEQTGYSLGPFVLLMCVSLVLCAVRLTARSLASSVLVHSCYNLLLFSLMLAGTGGFRHLERM